MPAASRGASAGAKTYDAEYVALARRLSVPLVTIDARLMCAAGHVVTLIGPD